MEKVKNPVDDFFKESLQDYNVTPSKAARSRFLDEAAPPGSFVLNYLLRWYNIIAFAILISVSLLIYFGYSNKNAPAPGKTDTRTSKTTIEANQPIVTKKSVSEKAKTISQIKSDIVVAPKYIPTSSVSSGKLVTRKNFTPIVKTQSLKEDEQIAPFFQEKVSVVPGIQEAISVNTQDIELTSPALNKTSVGSKTGRIVADEQSESDTSSKPDFYKPNNLKVPPAEPKIKPPAIDFVTALFYHLDWDPQKNRNNLVHTIGVEGKVQYERFTLTTGFGVTTLKGLSNYEVEYNDYLGNYKKIDSITFAYDQQQYYLVPTYHYSVTKVWDTAIKSDSYYNEKQYYQLNVPVMIGFEIINRGKFKIGVKTGVEMLFYLGSNVTNENEYSSGLNNVVNVNPLAEEYKRTNIWAMANISAAYNLSKRLVFEIEPHIKYLVNPNKTFEVQTKQEVLPMLRSTLKIKF